MSNGDIPGTMGWTDFQLSAYWQAFQQANAGYVGGGAPQVAPGGTIGGGGATPAGPESPTPVGASGPIYTGEPGPLSPGELSTVLGEPTQSSWPGSWAGAGMIGDFFRRRSQPSRYERALRQGGRALERALLNTVQRIIRGPATPVISKSTAIVPYVGGPLRFVFGPIAGLILGVINPTDLGSGELTARQRTGKALDVWFPEMRVTRPRIGSTSPPRGPQPSYELMLRMPTMPTVDTYIPQDRTRPAFVDIGERLLERGAERLLGVPVDISIGPPAPKPVPQITIGGPNTPRAPQQPQQPQRPRPRWGIGTGAILAGLTVEALGQREMTNIPEITNIPTPTVAPLTAINTSPVGFFVGGAGSQYCTPRPRGPRRKCLQRAPVRFSGGPRKGKNAGTKCIRYAGRRT